MPFRVLRLELTVQSSRFSVRRSLRVQCWRAAAVYASAPLRPLRSHCLEFMLQRAAAGLRLDFEAAAAAWSSRLEHRYGR